MNNRYEKIAKRRTEEENAYLGGVKGSLWRKGGGGRIKCMKRARGECKEGLWHARERSIFIKKTKKDLQEGVRGKGTIGEAVTIKTKGGEKTQQKHSSRGSYKHTG